MMNPYVQSNFARVPDDYYPTIDERCVDGFMYFFGRSAQFKERGLVFVDPCSPSGSGIVDALQKRGFMARGETDALGSFSADYIVTNPPYTRSLVDEIINAQIARVERGEVMGAAFLLRTNFDHAKGRRSIFNHLLYSGQIKLCFRPWWSANREHQPIHNYVWHAWGAGFDANSAPFVKYYYDEKEKEQTNE